MPDKDQPRLEKVPPVKPEFAEAWLTPGRFAIFLALLIAASFPSEILGSKTFIIRDFGLFSYPVAFFHRQCFWHGEIPLWNPYNHCGLPFLAQWNTLTLYPLSLIYLLLPLAWSLPLFCLAHLFWGGLGMYLLAGQWTRHRLAGAVAGVIFAFNGLSLNFLMWPSHIATFGWLPWMLWLAPPAWKNGGRALVWAVLAGAMQMFAGGPETIAVTWLLLGLIAIGDWVRQRELRVKIPLRFLAMAGLVTMICAAQLLPFLQLATHSQRDAGFSASDWAMPIWGWANFLLPLFRLTPTPQGLYLQGGQYWTSSYYAGIGTILLIAVAVRRVRGWRMVMLLTLLALSLVLALGDNGILFRILRSWVPGIGLARYPVKFVIVTLAVAPLIAAFGIQALFREPSAKRGFEMTVVAVMLLLIGSLVFLNGQFYFSSEGDAKLTLWNGVTRGVLLAAGMALVVMLFRADGRKRMIFGCLLVLTIWLDLITHVPNQNPGVVPEVFTPGWAASQLKMDPQPQLGGSRAMLSPTAERDAKNHTLSDLEKTYLLSRLAYLADCNLLDNVPQVNGFFSLTPGEINDATVLPYVQTNRDFPALLDFMGVSQITPPGKTFEWAARPSAMPLVTVGQQPMFADDKAAFSAFYQTNVDFRQVVLLPSEAKDLISSTAQPSARVLTSAFRNQEVSITAEAPATSMVVIAQGYYPAWKAFVDGKLVKLWRANYGFQAVEIPAGRHEIRLVYQDRAFLIGLVTSAIGLLATLIWWRLAARPGAAS